VVRTSGTSGKAVLRKSRCRQGRSAVEWINEKKRIALPDTGYGVLICFLETEPTRRKEERTMKKVVLVTYNPDMMCFAHVLLYAIDFHEKGYDTKVVIEGGAVKLVSVLGDAEAPFYSLYEKVKHIGLIDCVCRACSAKLGSLEDAEAQGLRVQGDLMGHPSIEAYLNQGYQLITF
jgi:hypothetical protein